MKKRRLVLMILGLAACVLAACGLGDSTATDCSNKCGDALTCSQGTNRAFDPDVCQKACVSEASTDASFKATLHCYTDFKDQCGTPGLMACLSPDAGR